MPKGSKRSKGSEASTEESAFNRPKKLSANLADIVGMKEASPAECIRKVFAYLTANNLRDPENKQFFTPDKKLAKIYGTDPVEVFEIGSMKYLDNHLTKIQSGLSNSDLIQQAFKCQVILTRLTMKSSPNLEAKNQRKIKKGFKFPAFYYENIDFKF